MFTVPRGAILKALIGGGFIRCRKKLTPLAAKKKTPIFSCFFVLKNVL